MNNSNSNVQEKQIIVGLQDQGVIEIIEPLSIFNMPSATSAPLLSPSELAVLSHNQVCELELQRFNTIELDHQDLFDDFVE